MLLAYAIPLSHSSLHKRWRGSSYAILLWLLYQQRYLDGLISLAFTLPFIMKRCSSLEHTSKLFYFCSCSNQLKEKKEEPVCASVWLHGVKPWQDVYSRDMMPFNVSLLLNKSQEKISKNVFISQNSLFLQLFTARLGMCFWLKLNYCVYVYSNALAHHTL